MILFPCSQFYFPFVPLFSESKWPCSPVPLVARIRTRCETHFNGNILELKSTNELIQTTKLGDTTIFIKRFVQILVTEERPVTSAEGNLGLEDGFSEGEKNNSN